MYLSCSGIDFLASSKSSVARFSLKAVSSSAAFVKTASATAALSGSVIPDQSRNGLLLNADCLIKLTASSIALASFMCVISFSASNSANFSLSFALLTKAFLLATLATCSVRSVVILDAAVFMLMALTRT